MFALSFAVRSLRDRSVRSWLTIIGVVISIAVILTLLTLSSSLQGAVVELFDQFGADQIQIAPAGGLQGGDVAVQLLDKDVEFVRSMQHFDLVLPYLFENNVPAEYRGTERLLSVAGMPTDDASKIDEFYDYSAELDSGRWFRDDERGAVILGYTIAYDPNDQYFGREISPKTRITIENKTFEVVGIFRKFGTPDDTQVFIPLEDARAIFDEPYEVTAISGIVKPGVDIERAADETLKDLERRKGDDTVVVLTPQDIIRQFTTIFSIVQGILLGIASISLIVGALGIANTMFTSVLEREKEIGIIKSIGAKNSEVMAIFMAESGLIGLIGGSVGILLGVGISLLIGEIAAQSGFSLLVIEFQISHILFSLVFATIVGMLSGLLPSYIASRKRIVETLRST